MLDNYNSSQNHNNNYQSSPCYMKKSDNKFDYDYFSFGSTVKRSETLTPMNKEECRINGNLSINNLSNDFPPLFDNDYDEAMKRDSIFIGLEDMEEDSNNFPI